MNSCVRNGHEMPPEEKRNLPETENVSEAAGFEPDEDDLQLPGCFSLVLPDEMDGKRLDACLSELIPELSRSFLQKQITAGKLRSPSRKRSILKRRIFRSTFCTRMRTSWL